MNKPHKSKCCSDFTIKYSSIGINGDIDTHYTCTNCGKVSNKPKQSKEDDKPNGSYYVKCNKCGKLTHQRLIACEHCGDRV